jgi:hypothetical protein
MRLNGLPGGCRQPGKRFSINHLYRFSVHCFASFDPTIAEESERKGGNCPHRY